VSNGSRILDVGSGPFSTIGTEADITLCDLLADEYHAMMKRRDIVPVIPVEKQDMANMSYPDESFDLVHCRNALDHMKDPRGALREMARVCKPGGRIHLRHYPIVGESNNYTGSHYWNLVVFEGDCNIWNREEDFLMSEILPDVAAYRRKKIIECNWVK
jgi:ubiquinone/menaquinone biosynthesis C-methylase UbiE